MWDPMNPSVPVTQASLFMRPAKSFRGLRVSLGWATAIRVAVTATYLDQA